MHPLIIKIGIASFLMIFIGYAQLSQPRRVVTIFGYTAVTISAVWWGVWVGAAMTLARLHQLS